MIRLSSVLLLLTYAFAPAVATPAPAPAPQSFAGGWTWTYNGKVASHGSPGGDFQLTIRENGAQLSGDMTGAAYNGNKVSNGTFTGVRTGNSAKLRWRFKDGDAAGPVAGTARLVFTNGKLHWTLTYSGKQDCWFPRDAVLQRKAAR